MNQTLLLDNNMVEEFNTLSPYFNAPDVSRPYAVSGFVGLLSPSTSILSSFLEDKSPSEYQDTICGRFTFVNK